MPQEFICYHRNNEFKFPFSCPAIWTECSSHEYGVCYFCSIQKPLLKQKAKYVDCVSCKILRLNLPDLADRPDGHSASSCSIPSIECDSDIEFVNNS